MHSVARQVFRAFERAGIPYCHWKSNWRLERTIFGEGDFDIVVRHCDTERMKEELRQLRFIEVDSRPGLEIRHFYYLDRGGELLHFHVYSRLFSGGALLKNYEFPGLNDLVSSPHRRLGLCVPMPVDELLLFVVRKSLEHMSFLEFLLLRREGQLIREELQWLVQQVNVDQRQVFDNLEQRASRLYSGLPKGAILKCLDTLAHGNALACVRAGWSVRQNLSGMRQVKAPASWVVRTMRFARSIVRKALGLRVRKIIGEGMILAIVGPDASGKSTMVKLLGETLDPLARVRTVHVGKPPATLLTWLPTSLIPIGRRLFGGTLLSSEPNGSNDPRLNPEGGKVRLLLFGLRATTLAYERLRLLRKCQRLAARGYVVICDRYPSSRLGAMDSGQIDPTSDIVQSFYLLRSLAKIEAMLYSSIPEATTVYRMQVSYEVAVHRNAKREEDVVDPVTYLERRHQRIRDSDYSGLNVKWLNADRAVEESLGEILCGIWDLVHTRHEAKST